MIISIEPSYSEYVTTDDEMYPEYRRYESGEWECLMGMSWEYVHNTDELERQYQDKLWLQGKD
jgi:hypothetical protein